MRDLWMRSGDCSNSVAFGDTAGERRQCLMIPDCHSEKIVLPLRSASWTRYIGPNICAYVYLELFHSCSQRVPSTSLTTRIAQCVVQSTGQQFDLLTSTRSCISRTTAAEVFTASSPLMRSSTCRPKHCYSLYDTV